MKKYIFYAIIPVVALLSCHDDDKDNNSFKEESISMGSDLVYDVFYSFSTGEVAKIQRSDWDIALSVSLQTASIRINEGSGVELYPAGTVADWSTIDVTSVNPANMIWNEETDWLKGAFNRGAGSPNAFNFGWGTYNMTTHNVVADSIYIIKLTSKDFKKIMINKNGISNSYILKWENIDGTETDSATIDMSSASSKNFVYYSISSKKTIDYEPDNTTWDLLFTVYTAKVPYGQGVYVDYSVMGILTNLNYQAAKVTDKSPESATYADTTDGFLEANNTIGWDWKTNVSQTTNYTVTENQSYFVKNSEGSIYQIYFTAFGGKTTGEITFKTRFIE